MSTVKKLGVSLSEKINFLISRVTIIFSKNILTYLLTHSLTPWCRILFGKLIATQLVKKILSFGTRRFITVFTKAHH
jgi:hypothetical protein